MSIKAETYKFDLQNKIMPVNKASLCVDSVNSDLIALFVIKTDNYYLLVPCANQACVPSHNLVTILMIFWYVNKITLSGFKWTFYVNTMHMPVVLIHGCFLSIFFMEDNVIFKGKFSLSLHFFFCFNLNQPLDPRNYVPTNVPIFMNPRKLGPTEINDFTVIIKVIGNVIRLLTLESFEDFKTVT